MARDRGLDRSAVFFQKAFMRTQLAVLGCSGTGITIGFTPAHEFIMPAYFTRVVAKYRDKLTYVAVIACLFGIIAWGHKTHWDIGLGGAGEKPGDTPNPGDLGRASPPPGGPGRDDAPPEIAPVVAPALNEIRLSEPTREKWGVMLGTVERQSMDVVIAANGSVDYAQESIARLSTRLPGNVERVLKKVGDPVRRGESLAIIDAAELGSLKSDFRQAVVVSKEKSHTLERMKSVGSSLPERQLREAEADNREAHIRLVNAQQALMNLGLAVHLDEMLTLGDDALATKLRVLGLPEQIYAAEPPLTDNLLPLRAPFDGVVIDREVVEGEYVTREKAQFAVANIGRMWITLDVRKDQQNLVKPGLSVEFEVEGVVGGVQGKIDWVSTELDVRTRTLRVRTEVVNPPVQVDQATGIVLLGQLRAGTFGTGRITIRETPRALVVPNAAIQFDGHAHFVFVREGEFFQRHDVQVGVVGPRVTEIRDDRPAGQRLEPGRRVATEGSHMLKAELQVAGVQTQG